MQRLVNVTKNPPRSVCYNLTARIAPVRIETRTFEESRDGTRRLREKSKILAGSIRIEARGSIEVDDIVLQAPEVAAALARREIKAIAVDPPSDKIEATEAPQASPAKPGKSRRRNA